MTRILKINFFSDKKTGNISLRLSIKSFLYINHQMAGNFLFNCPSLHWKLACDSIIQWSAHIKPTDSIYNWQKEWWNYKYLFYVQSFNPISVNLYNIKRNSKLCNYAFLANNILMSFYPDHCVTNGVKTKALLSFDSYFCE